MILKPLYNYLVTHQSVRVQDNMSQSAIVFMSSVYVQITGNNIYVDRVDKEVTALLSG